MVEQNNSVEKKVQEIIYQALKKHQISLEMITPEKSIVDDLNADSLDVIDLMLAFEDEFGLVIEEDNIQEILKVQDIYDFISDNTNSKK